MLHLSTYPPFCPTYPPFCLPIHNFVYLSAILSPFPPFHLPIRHFCLPTPISYIYPTVCLHIHHFPTNLPICLYTFLPCLSTYPPFFSPVCHFVRISATFATFLLDLTVDTSNEDTLEITTLPRQHGIPDKDDIIF